MEANMTTLHTPSVAELSRLLYPGMWATGKFLDMNYSLLVVATGLVGNTLSAVVMLRKNMLKMTTTIYLLALAVSDLICNMFLLGRRLERQDLTIMTLWYCKLKMFFFYYAIHCSVAYIVAMTFEKFLVIWFPFRALNWCDRKRALITILLLSLLMLGIDGHNLFLRSMNYNELDNRTECTSRKNVLLDPTSGYFLQKVYPWIDAVIYCYIPLVSLFVLNILIVHKYRHPTLVNRNSSIAHKRALQLTGTSLLVSFMFMLCTLPIATLMIVEQLWTFNTDPLKLAIWNLIRKIANSLMYTQHAINFYLYCLSAKNFRDELRTMFGCTSCRRKERRRVRAATSSSATTSTSRNRTASTKLDSGAFEAIPENSAVDVYQTAKDHLTQVDETREVDEEGESNSAFETCEEDPADVIVRL